MVLDGTDNFATRLAISDACVATQVSLLSAAVGRFQGQVAAFAGHLPDQGCHHRQLRRVDEVVGGVDRQHGRRDLAQAGGGIVVLGRAEVINHVAGVGRPHA